MTRQEIYDCCRISREQLDKYDDWVSCAAEDRITAVRADGEAGSAPCPSGSRQYGEHDLELLHRMAVLQEIGFSDEEIYRYVLCSLNGSTPSGEQTQLLKGKRCRLLSEIHLLEHKLEQLDELCSQSRKDR